MMEFITYLAVGGLLVIPSSREKFSHPVIEPPTPCSDLGASSFSSGSLISSRTISVWFIKGLIATRSNLVIIWKVRPRTGNNHLIPLDPIVGLPPWLLYSS